MKKKPVVVPLGDGRLQDVDNGGTVVEEKPVVTARGNSQFPDDNILVKEKPIITLLGQQVAV
jgi:hypothetical protein